MRDGGYYRRGGNGDERRSHDSGTSETGPEGIDLWALGARVWARRGLVIAFVIFGLCLTFAALQLITPRYTGEVRLLMEGRTTDTAIPLTPQSIIDADQEKVASEIQVLTSRSLAEKVIDTLHLETWDEFKPDAQPTGLMAALKQLFSPAKRTPRAQVLEAYFERLNVYQVSGSRVITVDFWAKNPRSAALIANTIADLYLEDQLEAKLANSQRASSWLDQQVEKLRNRVKESESAVETFRRKSGLIQTDGNLLKADELSELNTQLILASAERAEVQARLQAARELLNSPNAIESSAEVLDSPLVQQLREQEVALRREITELSAELLPQHPDMIARQAELRDLQQAISREVDKIVRKLENEARVAQAREGQLRRSIDKLKGEVSSAKMREADLRALEREASANRELLESFLLRASEAGARDDRTIQRPDARIISRAEVPDSPSFPQSGPMLLMAGMASFTLGLLAVLATEMVGGAPAQSYTNEPARRAPEEWQPEPAPTYTPPNPFGGYGQTYQVQPQAYAPPPQQQAPYGAGYGYGQPAYQQPAAYQPPYQQGYPAAPQPYGSMAGYGYAAPAVPVVARIPAATGHPQHDQWAAHSAAQQLAGFISTAPCAYGGRIVRVTGRPDDLMSVARLLASQGLRVVAMGEIGDPRWVGLSDVLARRSGFEHVVMRDSYSGAYSMGWGTVAMPHEAQPLMHGMAALAQSYDVVLVGEPAGVAAGWGHIFDLVADLGLVIDRGQGASQQAMPQVAVRGIVQAGV